MIEDCARRVIGPAVAMARLVVMNYKLDKALAEIKASKEEKND